MHPNLQELVERKALPDWGRELLLQSLADGKNIIIGGRVCTGKTTLLGAIMRECLPNESMMLIDWDDEVAPAVCGTPNISTYDAESLATARLVQIFQDSKPDRLVVAEVRGAEAYDYLQAIDQARNSRSWKGVAFTLRTDSAREIVPDFMRCIEEHQGSPHGRELAYTVAAIIDLAIYVRKYPSQDGHGRYVVDRIMSVGLDSHGDLEYKTLLFYDGDSWERR